MNADCGSRIAPLLQTDFQFRMQQQLNEYRAASGPEYCYPWAELSEDFDELPLVGFGSLINTASAMRTITHPSAAAPEPVIVFGARRVYNYVMSDRSYRTYEREYPAQRRGVLNVAATGEASDFFNGVLLTLTKQDLEPFRIREFGYDLISVLAVPYAQPDAPPRQVFCLACRSPYRNGRQMLSDTIAPHPIYHHVCEQGCAEISPDFLAMFRYTTWANLNETSACAAEFTSV